MISNEESISVNIMAFSSAIDEIINIERFASEKSGAKGKHNFEDTNMLAIACMANAAYQDLIGYLSDADIRSMCSQGFAKSFYKANK